MNKFVRPLDSMPRNLMYEQTMIGALLVRGLEAYTQISKQIKSDDFSHRDYKKMWKFISKELSQGKEDVDRVRMTIYVQARTDDYDIDPQEVEQEVKDCIESAENVGDDLQDLANDLHEVTIKRNTWNHFWEAAEVFANADVSLPAKKYKNIFAMAQYLLSQEDTTSTDLYVDAQEESNTQIKEMADGVTETLVPTGYSKLDSDEYLSGGLKLGSLNAICARPGNGKSAFALNLMAYYLKHNTFKGPCLSFSLEMSNKQVLQRFYSYMTGVSVSDIARGKLIESANPNQWDDLLRENEALFGHSDDKAPKLLLNDENAISLSNIERAMAQCQLSYGAVGAVFIDYLQLMDIDIKTNGTKASALGEVTKKLKNLAKKYNTVIFILCQLNRAANNDSLKPSDIKDSGSIEQDCDVILMIGRKFKKLNYLDPSQQADDALLFVAKNRNGPVGKLEMTYNGRAMKFEENNLGNSYNNAGVTSDYS